MCLYQMTYVCMYDVHIALSLQPIIDISTAPAEADEPAALNDEGDAAGKTPSLPAAQEEAAVEESKEEDGRLSSELLAATNKMKESSKSPPSMVEAEETGGVEKTQRDVTTGQDGPMGKYVLL